MKVLNKPRNENGSSAVTPEPIDKQSRRRNIFMKDTQNSPKSQLKSKAIIYYEKDWKQAEGDDSTCSLSIPIGLFTNKTEAIKACRKFMEHIEDCIGYCIKDEIGEAA